MSAVSLYAQEENKTSIYKDFKYLNVSALCDYLQTDSALSLSELRDDARINRFKFNPKFISSTNDKYYCLKIALENKSRIPVEVIFRLENNRIDYLDFYIFEEGNLIKQYNWSIENKTHLLLGKNILDETNLILKPQKTYKLYFNLNNKTSENALRLPLEIYGKNYYLRHQFWERLFEKVYIGALFFSLIVTLFFGVMYSRKIYWYYCQYLLGLLILYTWAHNFLSTIVPFSHLQQVTGVLNHFAYLLIFTGYIGFSLHFLEAKKYIGAKACSFINALRLVYIVNQTTGMVMSSLGLKTLCINNLSTFILNPTLLILVWILIWYAIKNKFRPAYLFAVSFFPIFCVGFLLYPASEAGFISLNLIEILYVTHFFELILFSIGLIFHFKSLENEKFVQDIIILKQKKNLLKVEINAQERERERLAKDLHDQLGGTLVLLRRSINPDNQSMMELIDRAIEDLRSISLNLLPMDLTKHGLVYCVEQTLSYYNRLTNITFDLIAINQKRKLNSEQELHCYRIITEILTNIVKHSEATWATVQILFYEQYVNISVEDDGIGLMNSKEKSEMGKGLFNIQSRIEYLKTEIKMETHAKGSIVYFDVPILSDSKI